MKKNNDKSEINGSFDDIIKASVSDNPKPKEKHPLFPNSKLSKEELNIAALKLAKAIQAARSKAAKKE